MVDECGVYGGVRMLNLPYKYCSLLLDYTYRFESGHILRQVIILLLFSVLLDMTVISLFYKPVRRSDFLSNFSTVILYRINYSSGSKQYQCQTKHSMPCSLVRAIIELINEEFPFICKNKHNFVVAFGRTN